MTYAEIDTLVYDVILDLQTRIDEKVLVDLIATQSGIAVSYIEESLECLIADGYAFRNDAGQVFARS